MEKYLDHKDTGQMEYELLNHGDELEESYGGKFDLIRPNEVNKRINLGRIKTSDHFFFKLEFWRACACPFNNNCSLSLLVNQFQGSWIPFQVG